MESLQICSYLSWGTFDVLALSRQSHFVVVSSLHAPNHSCTAVAPVPHEQLGKAGVDPPSVLNEPLLQIHYSIQESSWTCLEDALIHGPRGTHARPRIFVSYHYCLATPDWTLTGESRD